MKRRDLMKLAPVALAAGAVPTVAAATEETPVMRAYQEWESARIAWEKAAGDDGMSDEEGTAWCYKVYDLADDVLEQPSTGPLDFIYKLMAQSFHGQHDIGDCPRGEELWAEARALIGGVA